MAEDLDDGEFWLPSQFLTDDDILMDFTDYAGVDGKEARPRHREGEKDALDGLESFRLRSGSTDPNSDLSSPVESVNGSTGTESDEDSELLLLSGLTRQMARSTTLEHSFSLCDNKSSALSSSPQSTLCTVGRGSIGGGSSRGSPTGPVSPPRMFKENSQNDAALDLLYAAVGEVARMRMTRAEEGTGFFDSTKRETHLSGSSHASRKPSPVSPLPIGKPHACATNYHGGFYPQPISQHQLQIQRLRQQQMMKQQRQGVWGQQQQQQQPLKPIGMQHPRLGQSSSEFVNGGGNNSRGLSPSAWPPLQTRNPQPLPVPGSVMRAGFLRSPGLKRESAGTGVFLPRRVGSPNQSSKKPEGALRFSAGSGSQRKHKSNRNQEGGAAVDIVAGAGKTDYGIQLPQEWTY